MRSSLFGLVFAFVVSLAHPAAAQKQGGTLRIYHRDNPPSASIHEEATISTVAPFMGIFNNLVVFDPSAPLDTPETIMPDLAESWTWDGSNTRLTFKLHQASSGTTASRSRPKTSSARGTSSPATTATTFARTRAPSGGRI